MAERQLPRGGIDILRQETGFNCGPASAQNVLYAKGIHIPEQQLAREMGTHTGGTDTIDMVANVLRKHAPQAHWKTVWLPNDPPTVEQRDRLWEHIVSSIDAGWGCVLNFVAPPGNHPKAVAPSDPSLGPWYGGSTVWHYVAALGYISDHPRRVLIVDSGFRPWWYFITLDQCATLIPPKGYCYSTAKAEAKPMVVPVPVPEPVLPPARVYPPQDEMLRQIWERTVGFG